VRDINVSDYNTHNIMSIRFLFKFISLLSVWFRVASFRAHSYDIVA